jgi:hypothetical protein
MDPAGDCWKSIELKLKPDDHACIVERQVNQLPRDLVPSTPSGRQDLATRMTDASAVLSERLLKNAARPSGKRKDPGKVMVNLSDPDAPLGLDKRKTYRPLYTVQKMVDPVSRLTIAYSCEASTGDAGMLAPMIDKTQQIVAGRLETVLAGQTATEPPKCRKTLRLKTARPPQWERDRVRAEQSSCQLLKGLDACDALPREAIPAFDQAVVDPVDHAASAPSTRSAP